MELVQDFALRNIYCAPHEDSQFRIKMIKVSAHGEPFKFTFPFFNHERDMLPNNTNKFHVFFIGGIPAPILNLKSNRCACRQTGWIKASDDMFERSFIMQIYNDDGVIFPRDRTYYKVNSRGNLTFAIEVDELTKALFDLDSFLYLRVYSYYYNDINKHSGDIKVLSKYIESRSDVLSIRREADALKKEKGDVMYFVNGWFTDTLPSNLPVGCLVEVLYDRAIITKEYFKIKSLRTFMSKKSTNLRYFIHRNRVSNYIQYYDDMEMFLLSTRKDGMREGLYYHQNVNPLTNITDKDVSVDSFTMNNLALKLTERHLTGLDKQDIVLFTREMKEPRPLVYNALKLHELYKLPSNVELDVMVNNNTGINDFRIEDLEIAPYWQVAGWYQDSVLPVDLAMDAVGYNGAAYYFGNTPTVVNNPTNIKVPTLYTSNCIAYEYNQYGVMSGYFPTRSVYYDLKSPETKFVEFMQGRGQVFKRSIVGDGSITVDKGREFVFIGCNHRKGVPTNEWRDISVFVTEKKPNVWTITPDLDLMWNIYYIDDCHIQNHTFDVRNGCPVIEILPDREDSGIPNDNLPKFYFDTVEVFLNGHRLTYGIDFNIDYPYLQICNKTYYNYNPDDDYVQRVHIRCTGIQYDKALVNHREVNGFVHHGALGRNDVYDIRDDRVFSCFIKGKMVDRASLYWTDEDNKVRVDNVRNGMPYSVCDRILSLKVTSGLPTLPYYLSDHEKNIRVSQLFTKLYPQPKVDEFNIIGDHHYLYSPLLFRIIIDLQIGLIPQEVYTRVYHHEALIELIAEKYPIEFRTDPIRKRLPYNLIEIHPTPILDLTILNIFQYRFLDNCIKYLTGDHNNKVNLSGYIAINEEGDRVPIDPLFKVGHL